MILFQKRMSASMGGDSPLGAAEKIFATNLRLLGELNNKRACPKEYLTLEQRLEKRNNVYAYKYVSYE